MTNKEGWEKEFDRFMQKVAIRLGLKKGFMGNYIYWRYYLNPIWHIKKWLILRRPTRVFSFFRKEANIKIQEKHPLI